MIKRPKVFSVLILLIAVVGIAVSQSRIEVFDDSGADTGSGIDLRDIVIATSTNFYTLFNSVSNLNAATNGFFTGKIESINGIATNLTVSGLSASKAMVLDAASGVTNSTVSSLELLTLTGSSTGTTVQAQIDDKPGSFVEQADVDFSSLDAASTDVVPMVVLVGTDQIVRPAKLWVDSIADLHAIDPAEFGNTTAFCSDPTRGGLFRRVATSGVTTNTGTVFVCSANSTYSWQRVFSGPVDVRWFGAVPDDDIDDSAAIQAALDADDNSAFIPAGVFTLASAIDIPLGGSLSGTGADSILMASTAMSGGMVTVDSIGSFGNRSGAMRDLYLDGNDIAEIGLYVGISVQRVFENITITQCTLSAFVADATQNTSFIGFNLIDNERSLLLLNGAGNNVFIRCEFDTANSGHVEILTDAAYGGYAWSLFSNIPTANLFLKCVFERPTDTATPHVTVTNGNYNSFRDCDFSAATGSYAINMTSGAQLNVVDHCVFAGGTTGTQAIEQRGFKNSIINCAFSSFAASAQVIQVYTTTFLSNLHFSDSTYTVSNKSGNIGTNIKWTDGTTWAVAESPPTSNLYPGKFFYNTTDEVYFRTTGSTIQIQTGGQKSTAVTGSPGTSHGTTLQLSSGAWMVHISSHNGDSNHTRSGTYIVKILDATNDVTDVTQIGSDVVSGSVITVLNPTVDAAGLLTIAATTSSSQTVTITAAARYLSAL